VSGARRISFILFKSMNTIKLAFTDFPGPANPEAILSLLKRHFPVTLVETNPDFLFYSVFGNRFLNFPNTIRIFFTGENVHADFNLCDYAFGFDWMQLEDRYCRCPNYQLYDEFSEIRERRRTMAPHEEVKRKTRFCNFIYSNSNAHPFREELFARLHQYKPVDSAGVYLNNTGFKVGSPSLGSRATRNKIEFQQQCRFSIAIENSSTIGYTTEKLVHALAADTIPIYWGNPEVGREFNTERFVNCHEFKSLDAIIERIREIDQDDAIFSKILGEPFFPEDVVPLALKEETVVAQFRHIFSQGQAAARRNRHVWGKLYEARRKSETTQPTLAGWMRHRLKTTGSRQY
jgi:hypothetical protein